MKEFSAFFILTGAMKRPYNFVGMILISEGIELNSFKCEPYFLKTLTCCKLKIRILENLNSMPRFKLSKYDLKFTFS